MKQNNFLNTAFLLLALLGGASSAWADGTISIPQDLGSYIPIGTVPTSGSKIIATGITLTGCSVDGNAGSEDYTSYTIGSTGKSSTATFSLTNETLQDYLFSFKSGSRDQAVQVRFTLSNGNDYSVQKDFDISDTNGWTLTESHVSVFNNVPTGTLTLTMTMLTDADGFFGNYGNFSFTGASQLPLPQGTDEANSFNWNRSTCSGTSPNGTYLTNITQNAYAEIYTYVTIANYYYVFAEFGYYTTGSETYTITVTDMTTGNVEVDAKNFTIYDGNDNKLYKLTDRISAGWKKIRLDFPSTPTKDNFRLQKMYFGTYDVWPLVGATTTYLDLSKGSYGYTGGQNQSPKYENKDNAENVGYVKDGGYAEYIATNNNETAYYAFRLGISNTSGGTIKVTITNLATSTIEVDQNISITSGSNYGDQMFIIDSPVTAGLKKIRFDFSSASTGWLFNYNHVTFYKRSLNEGYDYTPVAATGVDVVLTRSITADNWSTIVLPFSMTAEQVTTTFGEGTKIAGISSYSDKKLSTEAITSITANVPCFIKVPTDFSTATISGVTIQTGTPEKEISGNFKLVGTYSSATIANGDFFLKDNQLYKSTGKSKIKPFRAYFTGVPADANARLTFYDDEATTGVQELKNSRTEELKSYYDLQGRHVAQPTKGLYIVNGKKVIIK